MSFFTNPTWNLIIIIAPLMFLIVFLILPNNEFLLQGYFRMLFVLFNMSSLILLINCLKFSDSNFFFYSLYLNYDFLSFFFMNDFSLNFLISFDYFSTPLLLLTNIVINLVIYYSISTTPLLSSEFYLFIALLMSIYAFLNLAFSVLNLFLFYIFFDLLLIPVFLLIGFGSRFRKLRAATFFFIYTASFSYFFLLSLALIWLVAGSFDYFFLKFFIFSDFAFFNNHLITIIPWFIFIGFLAKLPVFPFHIWLPEAHVEAPTVGSVILAALLLKLGTYGLFRFAVNLSFYSFFEYLWFIKVISLFSSFFTTYFAVVQVDLKRVIAYSSVAHMSFSVVGIFSTNIYGYFGAFYYSLGHGLISSGLFFLVGMLYKRFGTRLLKYYSGLSLFPNLSFFFLFFSFSNLGFPGTVNFVSEFLLFLSLIYENYFFYSIIFFLVFFGSLFYSIWVYLKLFAGSFNLYYLSLTGDLELHELNILKTLLFLILFFGLFPNTYINTFYYY